MLLNIDFLSEITEYITAREVKTAAVFLKVKY